MIIDSRQSRELRSAFFPPCRQPFRLKDAIDSDTRRLRPRSLGDHSDMHFFCRPPIADRKSYDKGSKVKIDADTMEVTHHFVVRNLSVGDVVCGRALFSPEEFAQQHWQFARSYDTAK